MQHLWNATRDAIQGLLLGIGSKQKQAPGRLDL
jgi:hypothetical protein